MISWPVVRYVLTAALRDRLVLSLLVLMVVGASTAIFLGSNAVIESAEFAAVFAAAGLRLVGVGGLVLFIVFYLRRAFDSKDVEFLLSRPVSRIGFMISHSVAFMLLAALVALFVFLTICAIAPQGFGPNFVLWGVSLLAEYIIIVNVAMFFAMVLPSASTGALAIFAFYFLARIIGQILGIIESGVAHMAGADLLTGIMHFISLIVPRLDMMAQTSWLLYGSEQVGYGFLALQAGLYSALVIAAALVDLVRRQF